MFRGHAGLMNCSRLQGSVAVSVRMVMSWLVVAVFSAVLAGSGFAHRVAVPEFTPELLDYLESGGSLSDICGPFDSEGSLILSECEACRLAEAVCLPPPALEPVAAVSPSVSLIWYPVATARTGHVFEPSRAPRAPPFL